MTFVFFLLKPCKICIQANAKHESSLNLALKFHLEAYTPLIDIGSFVSISSGTNHDKLLTFLF
jgi:hypothetical protein